jgi:hypothetical protein
MPLAIAVVDQTYRKVAGGGAIWSCRRPGTALTPVRQHRIETDHGRGKARLGPMRGLNHDGHRWRGDRWGRVGQKLRRGHDELAVDQPANQRLPSRSTNWPWCSALDLGRRFSAP